MVNRISLGTVLATNDKYYRPLMGYGADYIEGESQGGVVGDAILTEDGDYIYLVFLTKNYALSVNKIDKRSLQVEVSENGLKKSYVLSAAVVYGNSLYISGEGFILKCNKQSLATEVLYDNYDGTGRTMKIDETGLYVGRYDANIGHIKRFNKDTLELEATSELFGNNIYDFTMGNDYIYATGSNKIVKYNKVTLEIVASIEPIGVIETTNLTESSLLAQSQTRIKQYNKDTLEELEFSSLPIKAGSKAYYSDDHIDIAEPNSTVVNRYNNTYDKVGSFDYGKKGIINFLVSDGENSYVAIKENTTFYIYKAEERLVIIGYKEDK